MILGSQDIGLQQCFVFQQWLQATGEVHMLEGALVLHSEAPGIEGQDLWRIQDL